jgi:hypothetical protein
VVNGLATTAIAISKPAIFNSINSTGQIVVYYETHGGTAPGGNAFARSPTHKVIGFPEVAITGAGSGVVIFSGVMDVKNLLTVTAGGFMKWASATGVGSRMAAATKGDVGMIRGFWMETTNTNSTALAFVLPWMI